MKKILLTGASGFIGGHIHQAMEALGNEVFTMGRSPQCNLICDLPGRVPVLPSSFQWVIHAMGLTPQVTRQENAESYHLVNTIGTRHLCQALENSGTLPEAFVFISTVAVYGLAKGEGITEDAPLLGGNPYADSKIEAEQFLQQWCNTHQVPFIILRLPLVAGANAPGTLQTMIQAIASNRYFNIDGGFVRKSMVMVEDVAAIIPEIIKYPGIYNLTDDEHPTLAALAHVISFQMGKRDPMNIPKFMALPAAFCFDLLGKKAPLTVEILEKLTSSLYFSNQKIKDTVEWRPQAVTLALKVAPEYIKAE